MSKGINKAIILGNVGGEPNCQQTKNGTSVTNLTVATNYTYKKKETGENINQVEWHKITIFGQMAENAKKYLTKGDKVYIEGKLKTTKWQTESGEDRYTTEIIAKEVQFLSQKSHKNNSDEQWEEDVPL